MWATSEKWNSLASPQYPVVKISVYNGLTWLADLQNPQPGGSVAMDESQAIRRTATFTLESQGRQFDSLVPVEVSDLLNPLSGNELRIYRGFDYRDGSDPEFAPQGVFRLSQPKSSNTGGEISVAVTGNDRAYAIQRNQWTQPYGIASATPLGEAVQAALEDRASWLASSDFLLAETSALVPATTFGASSGSDPWSDISGLATAAGMELFFNTSGQVVMRPVPDPSTSAVVATCGLRDGLVQAQMVLDETATYDGVVLACNGAGGQPLTVEVWAADAPANPVPYRTSTSHIPYPGQSTDDATEQATAMAQRIFLQVCRGIYEPSWEQIPNPALEDGDCIALSEPGQGIDGNYVLSTSTMPLDIVTAQSITGRSSVAVASS